MRKFIRSGGTLRKGNKMKKFISIIMAVAFVVSMTVIAASAQSYNPNGICEIKFEVKHADPANVIKDGIIGEGEYERYYADLDPDTSSLTLVFGDNSAMYANAEEMLSTMEYYFSWDEVHGFNFAIKCKPGEFTQTVLPAEGEKPGDDFLCNLGLQINLGYAAVYGDGEMPLFYYAISKNATTGEYLEGHYNQLGLKGAYDPTPGTDYEVAFGADGTVTYEWSFTLDNFTAEPTAAGTNVYFSLAALAGTDTPDDPFTNCYGVSLGGYGFMIAQSAEHCNAIGTFVDEQLGGGSGSTDTEPNPGPNPTPNPNPGPNPTPNPDNGNGTPTNDHPSNNNTPSNNTPSNGTTNGNGTYAPSTGDASVIAAVASVLSALGFAVSKKRR